MLVEPCEEAGSHNVVAVKFIRQTSQYFLSLLEFSLTTKVWQESMKEDDQILGELAAVYTIYSLKLLQKCNHFIRALKELINLHL